MKTSVWWFLGAVLWWSCAPFHKPVARPATSHANTTLELPSGLRVVIEERPGTRRVAMALLVGVGGRQDPKGKEGLAHFVEHLVFRARPTHRLSLLDELHYAAAADVNAATSHDTTTFIGVAPASRVEQFVPLLAALATRSFEGVSDEAFEVERNVVRAELFTLDDPHGVGPLMQKVVELAMPPESTGGVRALGGTPESLEAFTRADVEKFFADHYRPENCTVVIAGDVTAAQVKALLPAAFPSAWLNVPAGGPRTPRRIEISPDDWLESPPPAAGRVVVDAPVEAEHLVIAWAVPGKAAAGGAALPLLALRGISAKVNSQSLFADADVFTGSRASVLYLDIELPKGVTPEAASAALREQKLTASLAGTNWRQLLMMQAEQEQDLFNVAFTRADRLYNSQPINGARETSLTASKEVLDKLLTWDRAREMVLRPARRVATQPNGAPPLPLKERPPALQTSVDDFKAVALGFPAPDVRSFTLENGLQVVLSRRTDVPLASVSLTLPTGSRHISRSSEYWLPYIIDWRTNNGDMNRVGPPVMSINADTTTIHDTELSTQLPVLIDWLGHFLAPSANSTPGLFQVLLTRASWENSRGGVFSRLPFDLLPPDSRFRPFGKTGDDERQWLEMRRFIDTAWRPNGSALVIDGDLDFDATEKQVRELFSDWPRQSSKTLLPLQTRAAAPKRDPWSPKLVSIANKDTTRVEFGCRLPPLATPELRGGAELLIRSLERYFEEDLRIARGVTYDAHARATVSIVEDNLLNLSMVVDARDGQAATKRFFTLLDELDGAVWDDVLVNRARWAVAQSQLVGESGSTMLARRLSESIVRGATVADALNEPLRWSQTPLKFVDQLWNACNDTYELRLEGDEATLEPLLAPRRK